MKLYVLFIVMQQVVTTQEFFNETACMRAHHELTKHEVISFCLPKMIS